MKMAADPNSDPQYCGCPDMHGVNAPRGGGFSIMKDLAYDLHDEANEFADVNPRLAKIGQRIMKAVFPRDEEIEVGDRVIVETPNDLDWHERKGKVTMISGSGVTIRLSDTGEILYLVKGQLKLATSGDESPAQQPAWYLQDGPQETAKKSSDFRRIASVVPSLMGWNMYAGGTGVDEKYHSYDIEVDGLKYSISPFSTKFGRFAGYFLSVFPGRIGGHAGIARDGTEVTVNSNMTVFRSPYQAVLAAKMHNMATKVVTGSQECMSGFRRGSMGNGSPTEAQQHSITMLERKGFRQVSDFVVAGEFTVVMQKRRGPMTYSGEVEEDGSVNGQRVEDFLRSSTAADRCAVNQWVGPMPIKCDICHKPLQDWFVDGRTTSGSWANMCQGCFHRYGVGIGPGRGQKWDLRTGRKLEGSEIMASIEIKFYNKNGSVYATARDDKTALHLWSQGRWDFSVNGKQFGARDWRGREEIEKVFGQLYRLNTARLKSRRAMYWCSPDRTYRLTQQEQNGGMATCPKCRVEMLKERFTRSDKLWTCPECGFKIPTSKAVTKVEVKVPENVSVQVTKVDENGDDVAGENVPAMVATRRGRFAAVDPKELVDLPRMTLSQIAMLVYKDWKNVNYGAKPYLEAMSSMQNVSDNYGLDSGASVVAYFLANANAWRGEVAKAVKKELQRRIR